MLMHSEWEEVFKIVSNRRAGLLARNILVNRLADWGGRLCRDVVRGKMEKIIHTYNVADLECTTEKQGLHFLG